MHSTANGKIPPFIQWLRIMKLTAIFLLLGLMQVAAKSSAQVTLKENGTSLEKVLKTIKLQSGYDLFFNEHLVKTKGQPVYVNVANVRVETALKQVFQFQKSLTYSITGNIITVKAKEENKSIELPENPLTQLTFLPPPPIDIRGRIINDKGEPVVATVLVKGTNKASNTNESGDFFLREVDSSATLVISGVNIETFEIKVNGRKEFFSLTAKMKITALADVQISVNTGYQKLKPQNFVGSYTKLDSAAFQMRPATDIIGRLEGMVPGILFDKKSPSVSNPLERIQIRGISTLNYSDGASPAPLIVVDNFPFKQDLSMINPNDVENIVVLKDAAATSIWGAQAGNGVIVITTKGGKYNQRFHVNVTSNYTIREKPNQFYNPSMKVSDFIDAEISIFNKGGYDATLADNIYWPRVSPVVELLSRRRAGTISAADSASQIDAYRTIDYRRELDKWVYRKEMMQQHFINFGGGGSTFNYSFSGGYMRSLSNVQNTRPSDQVTINSAAGLRIARNLELTTGINISMNNQRNDFYPFSGRIYPYAQLAGSDGSPLAVPFEYRVGYHDTLGGGRLLDWKYRPLDEVKYTDNQTNSKFTGISIGVSYKPLTWATVKLNYQYNSQMRESKEYAGLELYNTRKLINLFTNFNQTNQRLRYPIPIGGILEIRNFTSASQYLRAQLDVAKTFNNLHAISGLIAAEVSDSRTSGNSVNLYGYNNTLASYVNTIDYLNLYPQFDRPSVLASIPDGNKIIPKAINRFVSLIANASYTFNNKYTVYASARKDGSNLFGVATNKKWKPLWSTGVSWNISGESFYHLKWMSSLRLRASYGFSGSPGNAIGIPVINYFNTVNPITNFPYATTLGAPNPNLRWEKVRTVNVALDFSALNNRLSGSFDIFRKKSTDVIYANYISPATGIQSYDGNYADLSTKGFDLTLNSVNIQGKFRWQTTFNLSHAKTTVGRVFLTQYRTDFYENYAINPTPGQIAYGISSFRFAGLDPATGNPLGYIGKQVSNNYNGILSDSLSNQNFHGSAIPLYFGNISNSFSWKGFSLFANISYRLAFYYRKSTINYESLAYGWEGHPDYALRWQKPGDEKITTVPSFNYPFQNERDRFYKLSEVNVLRGDNIRLNDLRLQYSLPLKKISAIKSLQFSVAANQLNIILWKKAKSDYDPDLTGGSGNVIPPARTWTMSMNIGF